jgi:CheY-like chemotaxis protein
MECIQLVTPQLIVLDPALPEKDGFSLVDWLRQSATSQQIRQMPLAVYSASDLDEQEQHKLRLGPTLFCTKGRVTPNELEQRVVSWFAQLRQVKNTSHPHDEHTLYERRTANGNEQMPAYH